jgi:SAM-dependent methyltransferase
MRAVPFVRRRAGGSQAAAAVAAIGHLDSPAVEVLDPRPVLFAGWALDAGKRAAAVEVIIGGTTVIPARLGIGRPDVAGNLELTGAAADCGWAVTVDVAPWPEGTLSVQVRVEDASGVRSTIVDRVFVLRGDLRQGEIEDSRVRQLAAPEWPWDLPDFLAETAGKVIGTLSPEERMPADDSYLEVGRSALKAIQLAEMAAGGSPVRSILDMPCGHGRVLRWLKAAYPHARLTACDLLTDGVDFCAATFGATPVYSSQFPTPDAFAERYDLIFVGSLLTHVDVRQWDHLIALWHELLNPEGLLVVTTHGELVAERMRAGHNYGYPAAAVVRTLRSYEHAGFAFLEEPPDNIEYGITIATPAWTVKRLLAQPDLRLVMYSEALWHRHQDVAAVAKRPWRTSD